MFDKEATARVGIARLEAFFHSIGPGATLASLKVGTDRIDEMARKATDSGTRRIGNFVKLDSAQVAKILKLAA
jgi:alcohol dehydrogenase YqhD (iron-dependent ADH family)